jgi:hypothetical protein
MKRAPSNLAAGEPVECTSSWTLPIVDMALAATTGSTAVLLHTQASNDSDYRAPAWIATGVAIAFIVSAAYGAHQRARCARIQEEGGDAARPKWIDETKPPAGSNGAACKSNKDCGEDLVCDQPMGTCVPTPEPTPEATPP